MRLILTVVALLISYSASAPSEAYAQRFLPEAQRQQWMCKRWNARWSGGITASLSIDDVSPTGWVHGTYKSEANGYLGTPGSSLKFRGHLDGTSLAWGDPRNLRLEFAMQNDGSLEAERKVPAGTATAKFTPVHYSCSATAAAAAPPPHEKFLGTRDCEWANYYGKPAGKGGLAVESVTGDRAYGRYNWKDISGNPAGDVRWGGVISGTTLYIQFVRVAIEFTLLADGSVAAEHYYDGFRDLTCTMK